MRNSTKNSNFSGLKLALIITGSIVAAAGVLFIFYKIYKKNHPTLDDKHCDDFDSWELDDDLFADLDFDDEDGICDCGCSDDCDCSNCSDENTSDDIAAAVDKAIDEIGSVAEDIEK